MAKGPGVVLGRKSVWIGRSYFVESDYWPHDTTLWVKDFHGNHPRFVYYFFKSRYEQLLAMDVGSANPSLNRNHVHPIRVRWPPLPEQQAIAYILGTLDDKIELNRRMNETLEAMARAIFKSWFVDFDPVRAKLEGRQPPGLSPELAGLFPDSFEDSELGEIPKGWRAGCVSDVGQSARDVVKPAEVDKETPYIGLQHMPRRSIALGDWGSASEVSSNKSAFNTGDILFGKLRPYFHKVGVAPVSGVSSTDVLIVRPLNPEYFGLLLGVLSSIEFINYVDAASTGTKMPRTNWGDMGKYPLVIPAREVSAAFTQGFVRPLIGRIRENIHESRTLGALRDTLLPRLLSGELGANLNSTAIDGHGCTTPEL